MFSRERERERERARFFNQKPDAVVFLLKGAMKFVYQSLRLPFSHSHAHVFLSSKNFSKNFFPPLGLPLRNRISLDASQTPVLVKLSNVKLFVSRGRTARFVGRVLQSCVCFENINTILVLEFFSPSLSLSLSL